MTSFVRGPHEYVVPLMDGRGPDGRGRAQTFTWPERAVEVRVELLAGEQVDVVVLQRPAELELCRRWLRRTPGRDVPAIYVEHNTPRGPAVTSRHPLAGQGEIPIVHVTHFNRLMWDNGVAPATVIEHGIVDPGYRYSGEVARAAVVVNEPVRRGRAVGTDLMPEMAAVLPLDVFGMKTGELLDHLALSPDRLRAFPDLTQERLHAELARRLVYVHLHRWTSLGLSLLEAMHLGMPVVVLATTETPLAIPAAAGVISTDPAELCRAVERFMMHPDEARAAGVAARETARAKYGLKRFLDDWDELIRNAVAG